MNMSVTMLFRITRELHESSLFSFVGLDSKHEKNLRTPPVLQRRGDRRSEPVGIWIRWHLGASFPSSLCYKSLVIMYVVLACTTEAGLSLHVSDGCKNRCVHENFKS